MAKTIGLVFETTEITEAQAKPKYAGLKRPELDALALERSIDISGCNTKEMVIALLLEYDEAVATEQQE